MYQANVGIDGMRCGQCESLVSEMLSKIEGALIVKASHFKNSATILSPVQIQENQIKSALDGSGYRVLSFESAEVEKEPFSYKLKKRSYDKKRRS